MSNNVEDIFNGNGIKVELVDNKSFLMIIETLTRIGIISEKNKTLYQSCFLLHKRGQYAVLHFKELFLMDGKQSNIDENDYARRNRIAKFLEEWGLLKILPNQITEQTKLAPINQIKIIAAKDKSEYKFVQKYTFNSTYKKKP